MVSQWESGVRHPEPATLQKIAKALGVSVDWLVHGSEARAYSPEALATRLQELRESLGLTQEAFGAHVGVSRSMIAHWEGLVRQIGLPNLVRVAQGTGASLDWLVFGTGSMTSASTSLPKASEKEMRKVTSAMIDPTP
jgi:transcriptional regulator with XRE-family HTH domain